jgi:glyoxylase-like metal-dependent hydrolase (beta-lactamase superfamily II)
VRYVPDSATVRVVLAPNPGPMTGPGTNQYLLGDGTPLLIDVAAYEGENVTRLAAALAGTGGSLGGILLTHIHADHVGGVGALRAATGVPLAVHRSRAAHHHGGAPLAPERALDDGDEIAWPGGRLRAVHTPGHESGHCCYYDPERRILFTGDTILSTGTVVIPPPDGDMAAYLASLRRLRALDLARIYPGHGPPIDRPYEKIDEYIAHRQMREQQILDAVGAGVDAIPALVARIYTDLHPVLHWAAAATVRAHLGKLGAAGAVAEEPGARFRRR